MEYGYFSQPPLYDWLYYVPDLAVRLMTADAEVRADALGGYVYSNPSLIQLIQETSAMTTFANRRFMGATPSQYVESIPGHLRAVLTCYDMLVCFGLEGTRTIYEQTCGDDIVAQLAVYQDTDISFLKTHAFRYRFEQGLRYTVVVNGENTLYGDVGYVYGQRMCIPVDSYTAYVRDEAVSVLFIDSGGAVRTLPRALTASEMVWLSARSLIEEAHHALSGLHYRPFFNRGVSMRDTVQSVAHAVATVVSSEL